MIDQATIYQRLNLTPEQLADFCKQHHILELSLFGSILRDDFRAESDVDVMVQFHPDAHPTFSTLDDMETELKTLFDRDVDLITRKGIEASRNHLRRHNILSSAQVIYGTRSTVSTGHAPISRTDHDLHSSVHQKSVSE
ncbi:MAG: nucleotidyltransferase [Limnothrix sp. CACIAM 69d]|nr:MAG: nucleotidyltransferase [Limnothrix sp. CACIAM 69d]